MAHEQPGAARCQHAWDETFDVVIVGFGGAGAAAALEASIQALRSQLGGMILSTWQMPAELVTAAKEAENWYRDHPRPADYADLVVVAQLHEGVGGDIDPAKVPALARLGLAPNEIDRGLDVLHEAQEEVAAARLLLTG